MAQPLNRYKADLRDFRFLLHEQFGLGDLLGKGPFAEWGLEETNMVLDEVYRFACEVTGPYNQIGDEQGCRLENGRVITPDGFKQAWDKLWEAGWRTLSFPAEWGGQDAPSALASLCEEMLSGSNVAFGMYPGLSIGAAEVIAHFGTDRQRKLYLEPIMRGQFGGTMCLTESHAGSDVGAGTTAATRNEDGTYDIKGTKIFISGGDHDLAENIVHMVLARIEGAEPGTKGLSLFIVPRVRVNEDGSLGNTNDVQVPSIEHKMGIKASATCVMQFGDEDGCRGELVGTVEHQGMKQMFRMMNFARIGVGIQGLSVAGLAYLSALEYARDRKQGSSIKSFKDARAPRVAIIEHPNIRQDLLDLKARVEGVRALIVKLAIHQDHVRVIGDNDDVSAAYHKGQVDLLTPLVKAHATDEAFRVCERAMQIFGGHGYLRDHPVEQACRDAKIFSIYEGTNFIQSMDLVSRKLGQGGGANTKAFLGDMQAFIEANKDHPVLAESVGYLAKAHAAFGVSVMQFIEWFKGGKLDTIPLASEAFLESMSELTVGWLLLQGAAIAHAKLGEVSETHPDHAFYTGKLFAARHHAQTYVQAIPDKLKLLAGKQASSVEIPDAAFATV